LVPTIYNNLLVAATNYLNLGSDLVFLTLGILPLVEDDGRVKKKRIKRALSWAVSRMDIKF